VVFLDDDIVVQGDLTPLWDVDLGGKVNGAVETCRGEDEWVMSKRLRNYFNFSHPLIAKHLDPEECAWAYGMNIFDLQAWRKTNIRETYHSWLREVTLSNKLTLFCFSLAESKVTSLIYSVYFCFGTESKVKSDNVETWNLASCSYRVQGSRTHNRLVMAYARIRLPEQDQHRKCEESSSDPLQWAVKAMAGDWFRASAAILDQIRQLLK